MTSVKGFKAWDNEICWVSPRLRTKGSGDNQDCSDSSSLAQLPDIFVKGDRIIWPGKSRTVNTNISCCQIYLLLLSWVELSQQHWHPKDNQKVKIDNFFNKMQDDNPEPGPERLRLIYHDRLEAWSLRQPISSRYSEDLTNQRPPTPVSASCQGCSFQKWNWAEIAATLSRKLRPSAVLWWGSAVNKI